MKKKALQTEIQRRAKRKENAVWVQLVTPSWSCAQEHFCPSIDYIIISLLALLLPYMTTVVGFAPLGGLSLSHARALARVCGARPLWLCWAAASASLPVLERGLLRLYNALHAAAVAEQRYVWRGHAQRVC